MIKIYKCIIFAYLVYMNVGKVEWLGYLIGVCGVLAWVEVMTNEKLKMVKFAMLVLIAMAVIWWM